MFKVKYKWIKNYLFDWELRRHSLILTVTQNWCALDYKSPVNKKSLQLPHQQSDNLQYRSLLNIVKCILSMYSPFQIWSLYVIAGSQLAMPIYIGALLINCWKICYTPQKRKIFTTCKRVPLHSYCCDIPPGKNVWGFLCLFPGSHWLTFEFGMVYDEILWGSIFAKLCFHVETQIIPMNEMTYKSYIASVLFVNNCNF